MDEMGGEMSGKGGRGADGASRRELMEKMRDLRKYNNIVDVQDCGKVNPRQVERMKRAMEMGRFKGKVRPEQKERMTLMSTTPKFWMNAVAADLPGISRRYLLARWVTADDNPYFARALVNKLWGAFMGRGIVSPVDDFNSFNEPSHPRLLKLLADGLQGERLRPQAHDPHPAQYRDLPAHLALDR